MKRTSPDYGPAYFNRPFYREAPRSLRNRKRLTMIRCFCAEGTLLEIGCAQGGFLHLARPHFRVEGLDISPYAIATAQRVLGDAVQVADIEHLVLPRGRYNVIVAFNILEHIQDPQAITDKIYTALKPGGVLVGSVPHNECLVGSAYTAWTNVLDKTHCSTFDPGTWRGIFQASGFAPSDILFFGEVPVTRNISFYVTGPWWKHVALNLVFVVRKQADAARRPGRPGERAR